MSNESKALMDEIIRAARRVYAPDPTVAELDAAAAALRAAGHFVVSAYLDGLRWELFPPDFSSQPEGAADA